MPLPSFINNSSRCALCLTLKTLRKSHVIPNAIFRRIKQSQNGGQLVQVDDSLSTPNSRSQGSWWEYLLCAECEHIIGRYENYGLSLMRSRENSRVQHHAAGVTFHAHDYTRFKLFLTSLLWRAAVSRQPEFEKVVLPDKCMEEARISLLSGRPLLPMRLGCRLLRLIDDTSEANGGFSEENLKQFVITPIPRLDEHSSYYTFLFLIEGFLLEYFVRAVPRRLAETPGVHKDAQVWFVPDCSIFKVPELVKLMVSAYGKHDRGLGTSDNLW